MKQNQILKQNKTTAINHIQTIINNCKSNNIIIELDNTIPIGTGMTYDAINQPPKSIIGTQGLSEKKSIISPKATVRDDKFIKCLISIYHEYRHVSLAVNKYQTNNLSPTFYDNLAVTYLAQHNNNYYMTNRTDFITEIDAELHGILFAYEYINENFPDIPQQCIDDLFIDYVNNARLNTTYQIKDTTTPIQSMDDIIFLFDTAYDEALTSRPRLYYRNRNNDDEVMNLLRKPEYDNIFTQICNEKNPYEKDKMIAALTLHLHPEYENSLPALEHIDLSATTLFHQNLPDDKTRIRTMLANQELNINDNYEKNINISPQIL